VGVLLDTRSGSLIALSVRTVVGRSAACSIVIDDARASAEHAAIAWSGECWEVRDLGSLNGTWLDGRRLVAGERAPVRHNSRLAFGGVDAWILTDDRPAGPGARNDATREFVHSTSGILALPSVDEPSATIYQRPDGQWLAEVGAELHMITDRAVLELGGVRWLLFLPSELAAIPQTLKDERSPLVLKDVALQFAPSMDEEHVDVRVRTNDGRELLLPTRSSHYMLLTLARARIADAQNGIAVEEHGWIYASTLADMLQYTAERLNLEIFRARLLFAKLGFIDSTHLIERRTASRQLRIGIARLNVTRG
jgi:hypothetical protein